MTLVLLAASVFGFFAARSLPTEVEEQETLLNYKHQGSFDYTIYLKPSYLFGPPPAEPVTDPQYPVKIVDKIDFIYRYTPVEDTTEVVDVDGVMGNGDIWQKRIKVYPYATKTGEFSIHFVLDIEEIQEMYDEIETELGISSSPHRFTLETRVTDDKEEFIHSLPIKISNSLVEIPAELTHTQACGSGEYYYRIYLEENSVYSEGINLEPPLAPVTSSPSVTLKPGDVIFADLIESMDMTYAYRFAVDSPASEVIEVISDLRLKVLLRAVSEEDEDSQTTFLWTKEYPVLYTRESGGTFQADFPLDFNYYSEMINTIRTETGAAASSYIMVVAASTHTVAETEYGRIDETFTQTLSGTISGGVVEWGEALSQAQPGSFETSVMVPNQEKYFGLSVTDARILSTVMLVFWLLASLVLSGLYFAFGPRQRLSPGENYARQLGKKYQQRIAEAIGQLVTEGDKIISLASMEDLIKIADELGKPLIHEISGETGEVHNYYVSDGNTYFRFTIDSTEKDDITGEPSYRTQIRRTIAEAMRELGRRTSSSGEKDTTDNK